MDSLIAHYSSLRKTILDSGFMNFFLDDFNYHVVISPNSPCFEHVVYMLSYIFLKSHFSSDNFKIRYIPVFCFDIFTCHDRYFTTKLLELTMIDSSDFIFLATLPQQYIDKLSTSIDSIRVYVLSRDENSVKEIFDPQFRISSLDVNFLFNICNIIIHDPDLHNRALCELLCLTLSHTLHSILQVPSSTVEAQDLLIKISSLIPYFDYTEILTKANYCLDLSRQNKAPFSEVIETFRSENIHLYYANILLEFSNIPSYLELTLSLVFNFLLIEPFDAFLGVTSFNPKLEKSRFIFFVAKRRKDLSLSSFYQIFIDFLCQYAEMGLEVYDYDPVLDGSEKFYIQIFYQREGCIQLTDLTQIVSTSFTHILDISLDETDTSLFESLEKDVRSKHPSTELTTFSLPSLDSPPINTVNYLQMNRVLSVSDYKNRHPQDHDLDIRLTNASDLPIVCSSEKVQLCGQVNWKKLRRRYKKVVINQQDFVLDMELIQRYTKVYQHGGYLQDSSRLPVVLIYGKYLPFKFELQYPVILKQLFLYLISLLDSLIFDNYVLIYIHSGVQQTQLPSYNWIKQFYEFLNDRMKKCLTDLFIVNPSSWIKTTLKLSKPFISRKFWQKLHLVANINDLFLLLKIEHNIIPEEFLESNSVLTISK